MLIHPWDAALDDQEWREWVASTDRFGMLVVNNLDPAEAPIVVPTHFTVAAEDAGSEPALLIHLARPNPVEHRERVIGYLGQRDRGLDAGAATQQRRRLDAIGDWEAPRDQTRRDRS
ncbi:MAG: hypothetical protein QM714_14080 [Nocardioides sp.]|uniref:hypothetical protein n=1 Tax=Nocardioides sp. TaxID=35761 RepID=UPI0039E55007